MTTVRLALLLCSAVLLGACAAPQYRLLASVDNGGDLTPVVTPDQVRRQQLGSLSLTETVVTTSGSDAVVAPTNTTRLVFVEPHPHEIKVEDRFQLRASKLMVSEQNPNMLTATEQWDLAAKPGPIRKRFVITALNTGRKGFSGQVVVYDRMHPVLSNAQVLRFAKVRDQRVTKANLAGIPFIGLMTLGMDDFKVLDPRPPFSHRVDGEIHVFDFQSMALEPGEGVLVEFSVDVVLPPIEELRKTAVPLQP